MKKISNKGLTIVELSIVILIIGMLVVATLAGQSIIRQSKVSSDIAMIGSVREAIGTFRLKYNALPGDFKRAQTYWPTATNGNNNNKWDNLEGSEMFNQLYLSGFIKGNFDSNGNPQLPNLKSTGQFMLGATCPSDWCYGFFNNGVYNNNQTPQVNYFAFMLNADNTLGNFHAPHKKVDVTAVWDMDTEMDDGNGVKGSVRVMDDVADWGDQNICIDTDGNYRIGLKVPLICEFAVIYGPY